MRARALFLTLLLAGSATADETVLIAVASNFAGVAETLAISFRAETGIDVQISRGSTGKLYAQVVNGAPFDALLAADEERPRLLEESGFAIAGSRFTYATGSLVLWSRTASDCMAVLQDERGGRIALANPELAPYGRAAKQYLESIDAWTGVSPRAVFGQNILAVLQIATTGNVELALVARAHKDLQHLSPATCLLEVPTTSHAPIVQQAVLLDAGSDGAGRFLEYLGSDEARDLIRRAGYEVPE